MTNKQRGIKIALIALLTPVIIIAIIYFFGGGRQDQSGMAFGFAFIYGIIAMFFTLIVGVIASLFTEKLIGYYAASGLAIAYITYQIVLYQFFA